MAHDALLVLSFGGPEGPDDVIPFLENVTKGRNIPRERLKVVGKHYYSFEGVSPLNGINRQLIAELRDLLDIPVYFGNRNWHPYGTDVIQEMARDGVRDALVFATSAYGGYSACRQYDEDIAALKSVLANAGLPDIRLTKLRQFYDHPAFIDIMARHLRTARRALPGAPVVFTAHSIPSAADAESGRPGDKYLYSRQILEACRLTAAAAGVTDYDLAWQSRSGNPRTPWLEPDIVDFVTDAHRTRGEEAFIVCPIGFIADHMEVVWDLDTELVAAAQKLGVTIRRTATAGPTREFALLVKDLIDEQRDGRHTVGLGGVTVSGCTVDGAACAEGCCQRSSSRTA